MNEMQLVEDDETNLFDLWWRLREGWKVVLGMTALGIAVALGAIFMIPPKYEAVAVIQVGLVGQISQIVQAGQIKVNGVPVETPMQTVERVKTPAFQSRVAEALGDQQWLGDIMRSNSGQTKDLALQVIKATTGADQVPLIELRASSSTRETAQKKSGGGYRPAQQSACRARAARRCTDARRSGDQSGETGRRRARPGKSDQAGSQRFREG